MISTAAAQVNRYVPIYHDTLSRLETVRSEVMITLLCIGLLLSTEEAQYLLGCKYLHKLRQDVLLQVQTFPIRIDNLWLPESL
jgi:hypothetical protein